MSTLRLNSVLGFCLLLVASGCSTTDSQPLVVADAAVDAIGNDGDAGGDLFPPGTTKIVVTSKGGFPTPFVDGSVCVEEDATYTLLLPARDLSWKVCESLDGGPSQYLTGQKTLSASEYTPLESAIRALRRTQETQCGADKPTEAIVFTTPAGEVAYQDDFYFCNPNDTTVFVKGMDTVLGVLRQLAK